MKNRILVIAFAFFFAALGCKKKSTQTELEKLPSATQEGKNTFGCLINGKAWIAEGYDAPYPNFRVIVDPPNNILDVRAYSIDASNKKTEIFFGSTITSNTGVFDFENTGTGPVRLGLFYINDCYILGNDNIYRKGQLVITKYDLSNGIIAGEFNCDVYKSGCSDTVKISNGRFDKKL